MRFVIKILLLLCLIQGLWGYRFKKLGHGESEVEGEYEGANYVQKSAFFDGQLVNHQDPLDTRTYRQRYFVIEDFFKPAKGPVFLYICGEWNCGGVGRDTFPVQLGQQFGGLVLSLEHRYYGQSMPFGNQSLTFENMKYLSVFQALDDLAYFINYVKTQKLFGVGDNPWITIGGSYPGAMSAWFRYKFPHLTVGALASSAVVDAIKDFQNYDNQVRLSTSKSGNWCPEIIHNTSMYLQNLSDTNQTAFKQYQAKFTAGGFNPMALSKGEFGYYFADIFAGMVQTGQRVQLCQQLQNKTIQQVLDWAVNYTFLNQFTVEGYAPIYLQNTTYDPNGAGARSWTYQFCTEFGWLQTAYLPYPLRPTDVNIPAFYELCQNSFPQNKSILFPKVEDNNILLGAKALEAFNIVFTNGGEDPWQHASLTHSQGNIISILIDCDNCAHCVDLRKPSVNDAIQLQDARKLQIYHITKWLSEYKNGAYSPLFN